MSEQTISPQQTLDQKRAAFAWKCVQNVLVDDDSEHKYSKGYAQAARGAPADMQINGLGQSLAFWMARGKKEKYRYYGTLVNDLTHWFEERLNITGGELIEYVVRADVARYRQATHEAQAFLIWVKRFAEAEINLEKEDSHDQPTQ